MASDALSNSIAPNFLEHSYTMVIIVYKKWCRKQ